MSTLTNQLSSLDQQISQINNEKESLLLKISQLNQELNKYKVINSI